MIWNLEFPLPKLKLGETAAENTNLKNVFKSQKVLSKFLKVFIYYVSLFHVLFFWEMNNYSTVYNMISNKHIKLGVPLQILILLIRNSYELAHLRK